METKTIDLTLAQPSLNELLSQMATGAEIILTENNEPLVRMIPLKPTGKVRVAGLHAGAMEMRSDFDEPLPDSFWTGEE